VAVARGLRLPPRQLLLVGDGETDMLAARRSGALPIGATWGYRSARALLAAGAAGLLSHPRAVADYLRTRSGPAAAGSGSR
jgi:phosphoglycolate phosphatase